MKTSLSTEKTTSTTNEKVDVANEVSKIGIYSIAVSASLIGCWAIVTLIAGMLNSGGPGQLFSNLFIALTK